MEICILLAQTQFCLSGNIFRSCLCFVWCFSAVTAGSGLVAILKSNTTVHYKEYIVFWTATPLRKKKKEKNTSK